MLEAIKKWLFDRSKVEFNEILSNRVHELEKHQLALQDIITSLQAQNDTLREFLKQETERANNLQEVFFKRFGIIPIERIKVDTSEFKPIQGKRHVRDVLAERARKDAEAARPQEMKHTEEYWKGKIQESEGEKLAGNNLG